MVLGRDEILDPESAQACELLNQCIVVPDPERHEATGVLTLGDQDEDLCSVSGLHRRADDLDADDVDPSRHLFAAVTQSASNVLIIDDQLDGGGSGTAVGLAAALHRHGDEEHAEQGEHHDDIGHGAPCYGAVTVAEPRNHQPPPLTGAPRVTLS